MDASRRGSASARERYAHLVLSGLARPHHQVGARKSIDQTHGGGLGKTEVPGQAGHRDPGHPPQKRDRGPSGDMVDRGPKAAETMAARGAAVAGKGRGTEEVRDRRGGWGRPPGPGGLMALWPQNKPACIVVCGM